MELGLKDKVAVVSGSSRGIGRAIAASLLAEGAKVVISGRDGRRLESTVRELACLYSAQSVAPHEGDLTKSKDVGQFLRVALSRWGRVDIAVANIGSGRGLPFEESPREEWLRVLDTNLFGGMELVRQVVPVMRAQGCGVVCFVSSITGVEATGAPVPYSVSKAGVVAGAKALARSLADDNLRVNVVCPGNVLFPGSDWEAKLEADPGRTEQFIQTEVPMKRFGQPQEVADCVAFLVSERASFVTGACLVVDGGQTHVF